MKKEQRRPRLTVDEFQLIETYRELKRKAYNEGKSQDDGDTLYIESKLAQSPKDLIKEFKVDTEIWEQVKFEPGGWTTPVKTKFRAEIGDDIYTAQIPVVIKNKKTTAVFQKKTKIIDYAGFKRDLISDLKKNHSKGIGRIKKYAKTTSGDLLEVNLPDVHLGKFGWSEETGTDNYNTKIAVQRHNQKIDELISKALNYSKPEHILFVVGNDLFNSDKDTPYPMTTAGTPQENDTRWQKVFRIGRNMIIENIEKLKKIAPVTVKVIVGNHDTSKSFYLGDVLEVKYQEDKNVTIDNSAIPYKTFRWGNSLIGLSHGNRKDASEDRLVTWLNNEAAKYEGIKFKEVHCGDIHHLKEMKQRTGNAKDLYKYSEDVNGVIIRYLKTIMYNDTWEGSKRYSSQKGAHSFIWSKDGGNEIILNANG